MKAAQHWAAEITAALAALDLGFLTGAAIAELGQPTVPGPAFEGGRIASFGMFLASHGVALHLAAILAPLLAAIYADGYWIGVRSAAAALDGVNSVNWGGWRPGTEQGVTRRLLESIGDDAAYRQFEARAESMAAQLANTRLRALARIMADAVARGEGADQIKARFYAFLEDPDRAYRLALTELVAAQSAATVAAYQRAGIREHLWATAEDERVCKACDENAAAGAIQVGMAFPSGDAAPPIHPNDRCALLPVLNPARP